MAAWLTSQSKADKTLDLPEPHQSWEKTASDDHEHGVAPTGDLGYGERNSTASSEVWGVQVERERWPNPAEPTFPSVTLCQPVLSGSLDLSFVLCS